MNPVDSRMRIAKPDVLLLSMPWAPLIEPSLGLAILKARLEEDGISCRVCHLNIFLLKYLKHDTYSRVSALTTLNDFMFTQAFEPGEPSAEQIEQLERMSGNKAEATKFIDYTLRIRNEVIPKFLADCIRVVDESRASMVGFTCMYDQTIASLALAKLIKQKYPDKLLVCGGYALEKPNGPQIIRCFPFVDVVALGEGEDRITLLAEASLDRSRLSSIPGIMFRDDAGEIVSVPPTSARVDLETSPVPNYDDFINDLDRLNVEDKVEIVFETLPVESSRGCWWGQVSHCTFCGIDDETMRYRFKSPERVKFQLAALHRRYGKKCFRFSDYILPRAFYKTLLPDLAEQPDKYELHWEMKSNVKHEEIQLMRRAGVKSVQPGIESFSSPVLKRMGKGVTGIQNVLTIKLLMQEDVRVVYNILLGFPGDEPQDYREMCERVPLLYHLYPPVSFAPVLTTRYAPLQADPQRFGISRPIVREPFYEMIFSRRFREQIGFDLNDYCYIFERPYELSEDCGNLFSILIYQMGHWNSQLATREVRLSYEILDDGIEFVDSRYQADGTLTRFGVDHGRIYAALSHAITSAPQLCAEFAGRIDPATINEILADFGRARVIYQDGPRTVGLALPAAYYNRRADAARREVGEHEAMPA